MKPWGHIDWMLRWYPDRRWKLISGVGFEPRCAAIFEHLGKRRISLEAVVGLRIDDPVSQHTEEIDQRADRHQEMISGYFPQAMYERSPLLAPPSRWNDLVEALTSEEPSSILLDVSTLPKRVFFFLLKQMMRKKSVRDIVVCYAQAEGYREGYFVKDFQPPAALPGFGLLNSEERDSVFIVSVGYSTFDLRPILQQTASPNIYFLMPFPPASPSFRRTWRYLKVLNDSVELTNPVIERFSAVDAFAVYDWLWGHIDSRKNTTMLPLGPKPHSLAMALVQMKCGACSEVVYPQPTHYHPDYTLATAKRRDGVAAITAYGLRRDHHDVVGKAS